MKRGGYIPYKHDSTYFHTGTPGGNPYSPELASMPFGVTGGRVLRNTRNVGHLMPTPQPFTTLRPGGGNSLPRIEQSIANTARNRAAGRRWG